MASELWQKSASDLTLGYARGEWSPVEVLNAILERVEKINSLVNAIVTLDIEGASAAARASAARWDQGAVLGPFDGVPVTVKDNIPVRGQRTTWGSRLYANFVPMADELPIRRLRDGGAVLLGKTNCPEFTLQGYTDNLLFGPTRNPWNLSLTPGGSSGGAVAAVCAGLGPVAIGTDGGGSIRRPASHTGLVGLKPSRGRVPRCDGFAAILLDFETVGPIARTVADLMVAMRTLSDFDVRDPVSMAFADVPFQALPVARCRILYVPRFGTSPVDTEIATSVATAAHVFTELGHTVVEGPVPFALDPLNQAWPVISQVGLAWLLQTHGDWRGKVTPAIEEMAVMGQARQGTEYFDALNAVKELQRSLSIFFDRYDLIMTPTAAALPWPAAEPFPPMIAGEKVGPRGHAVFTAFANMAGCPGISIPGAPSANGLPIGFQLVAAPGRDGLLCALAAQYESANPWADRFPPL
jgi:aspartyl-tRNA(Asn)/glutamyl-tRNA(Gln) amidotransferase subunit A